MVDTYLCTEGVF